MFFRKAEKLSIQTPVTIGQGLTSWQLRGLELVSLLQFNKRDVVFALDLTPSAGFSADARTRLTQLIQNNLRSGDQLYIILFGGQYNDPKVYVLKEDAAQAISTIPYTPDPTLANTDIQEAELYVYKYLAQKNQDRLVTGEIVRPQSVVWVTDAPLFTKSGDEWIETPNKSPFRDVKSPESLQRKAWMKALDVENKTNQSSIDLGNSKLTVVDIPPLVQEICTPTPGGSQSCLVTAYLIDKLWLPSLSLLIILLGALFGGHKLWKWIDVRERPWRVKVSRLADPQDRDGEEFVEDYIMTNFKNKIAITVDGGTEVAYLEREKSELFIKPADSEEIILECNRIDILEKTIINSRENVLKCNFKDRKLFEIKFTIDKS